MNDVIPNSIMRQGEGNVRSTAIMSSLRDSSKLGPVPGIAIPGYRLLRPFGTGVCLITGRHI